MIWAGPQSLPRSPGIGWGHGGVQQPQPYFAQPAIDRWQGGTQQPQPQPYFPQPQPRFNPYASQAPFNPYANKFMPLPGPRPGPMPPPRSPGKGRYGRSYRPPTFPSNYGQMRYTPQRFGGYGIPSSLPGILNRPIGPPPGGPGRKGGGSPGKGGRPGGPGRKGGGGQFDPYHQTGQLPTGQFDPYHQFGGQMQPQEPVMTDQYFPSHQTGQLPGPTPTLRSDETMGHVKDLYNASPGWPQPGGGGMFGTLGGPGYGEFPLGTAGPRVDPSDPAYGTPPGIRSMEEFTNRNMELQQNQTNQFQQNLPPPPPPLSIPGTPNAINASTGAQAMVGDPVDVGFSGGVSVALPTMSQAQKRAQYFQKQRMNRAGYSTGGITDLPVDRRQNGGKTGTSEENTRQSFGDAAFRMHLRGVELRNKNIKADSAEASRDRKMVGLLRTLEYKAQLKADSPYFTKNDRKELEKYQRLVGPSKEFTPEQLQQKEQYTNEYLTPRNRKAEGGSTEEGREISNWNLGGGRLPLNMPRSGTGRMPDDVKNYFNTFTGLSPEGLDLFLVSEKENETIEQSMGRLSRMRAANDNPDHSQYGVFGEMLYQKPFERVDTSIPLRESMDAEFAELGSMLDNREETNMKRLVIRDHIKDLEARKQARLDKEK